MRYEENVLRDYISELRTVQLNINTKPELDADDMDAVAECLNRCEILVMSLLGSQAELKSGQVDFDVGEDLVFDTLSPEEIALRIQQAFGANSFQVILPDDDGFDEYVGEGESEDDKFSSDDQPKVKS